MAGLARWRGRRQKGILGGVSSTEAGAMQGWSWEGRALKSGKGERCVTLFHVEQSQGAGGQEQCSTWNTRRIDSI